MSAREKARSVERIAVQNVNHPGKTTNVDASKYHAMRDAMLKTLPAEQPGLTQAEFQEALMPYLPEDLFPGGEKAGWWSKTVQLDLEAKGLIARAQTRPLRWHRITE